METIENKYGPQCKSDPPFTAKARLLQSMFRVDEVCNEYGVGPNQNSLHPVTKAPSFYGNMLVDGETTGKNFFFPETFQYALKRYEEKKPDETIDRYRLFNNLLSNMPLAFNLFHPLMMLKENDPSTCDTIVRNLFPQLPVHKVVEIFIEYIPTPIERYTNEKSAMDAAILFTDESNKRYLIAIEVKYTDSLGTNRAKDNQLKLQAAIDSTLFIAEGIAHIEKGCTQIFRNFLLIEKYRMVEGLENTWSFILAPKDHPSTAKEIKSLHRFLKPGLESKLQKYEMENFVAAVKASCPPGYMQWINWFYNRYLNFSKLEHLNSLLPI